MRSFFWSIFSCIQTEYRDLLKIIQSYLSDQIQTIKINSSVSDCVNLESGVPLESISGFLYPMFSFVFVH